MSVLPQTIETAFEAPAFETKCFAAKSPTTGLAPFSVPRRNLRPDDVQIAIQYCGVCHSDLHQARDEWHNIMPTVYPCVPGHEIVGRVVKTGRDVKKFKEGDTVGVGCMVNSCGKCEDCLSGDEQYCTVALRLTYNSEDNVIGGVTYGGYSESIIVREAFVLRISEKLDPAGAAPLLCAGITSYSPMRHWNVSKGQKVGVVGLGGLGHMGVKFAKAFGAHVVLFTTSPKKSADAQRLGVDEVVISTDPAQMQKHANSFHFILNTVSALHDLNPYLETLKLDGTMTLVGVPDVPTPINTPNLLFRRRRLAGSIIGGIRETQEMLDFCAEHGITSDIELIKIQDINKAYERLLKSDVKYRFVIDNASLKA